jgi:hypothetical protein
VSVIDRLLFRQQRLEELYGVSEIAFHDSHREVDGVEVRVAVKTVPEIGFAMDPRFGFLALWTEKHEPPLSLFVRPLEVLDHPVRWDIVTKAAQQFVAVSLAGHGDLLG